MPFLQPNVTRIGSGVNDIGPGADIYLSKYGSQVINGNLRVKGNLTVDNDISANDITGSNVIGAFVSSTPGALDNTVSLVGGTVGFLNAADLRYTLDIADACGATMKIRAFNPTEVIAMTVDLSGNIEMGGDLTVDGELTAPNVVYGVQQGTNISITGTAQNPVINAVTNLNPNIVLDVFDSTPFSATTPAGGAATTITTLGGFVPETAYQISLTGFLQASADNLGIIMTMFLQPVGGGENLTLFQCPVTATEYGFSVSAVVKTPFIPGNPNPTTSYTIRVGGGGGLTTETITGVISNAVIIKVN